LAAVLATGNRAVFDGPAGRALAEQLKPVAGLAASVGVVQGEGAADAFDAALFEGDGDALRVLSSRLAKRDGPIVTVQGLAVGAIEQGEDYVLERLLLERSVSVNTAAAGGNANLMTIG
jgi:RHH-type proline utilization regulon transcriptional repressor/proline dehydrogenase/delta 1-pyrroline-5-carboxylate dehydrogenase